MTATTLVIDKTTVAHRIAMRYAGNNRVDYVGARSAIEQALELYDEAGDPRQLRYMVVELADLLDDGGIEWHLLSENTGVDYDAIIGEARERIA